MRLIDADRLLQEIWKVETKDMFHITERVEVVSAIDIKEAPTVEAIPIDKPFLKMRYGDYVVYNKKWLVDHLQTEWSILQGKEYQPSIPVEWIKEWLETCIPRYDYDRMTYIADVYEMLDDWEEENEKEERTNS